MAERRLARDLRALQTNPPPLCTASTVNDDLFHWTAVIGGPVATPYENGKFHLDITFPENYPFKPPSIVCKTRIFHPNVSQNGYICVKFLGAQWSPEMTMTKVLLSLCSLFAEPNHADPNNREASNLYQEDREAFDTKAREWTKAFAS